MEQVTQEDVGRVISGCLNHRLRKDPLDPIDSGTKVAILFKRLTDPEFVKREEEAKKKQEAAAAEAAKANKKAGELDRWVEGFHRCVHARKQVCARVCVCSAAAVVIDYGPDQRCLVYLYM